MPLHFSVIDPDGTPRSIAWGLWHYQVMELSAVLDSHPEMSLEEYDALPHEKRDELDRSVEFPYTMKNRNLRWHDPADGEIFSLPVGCVLHIWR